MSKNPCPNPITPREVEILDLVWQNNTVQEAADLLFISNATAETEIKNARKRNGVKNVASLYRIALKAGLISVP